MSDTKSQPRQRVVRKMSQPPQPVPGADKPKRRPRTKVEGWEKGLVRSACFYVQGPHHQAVNIAASALRVSKGIIVERAVVEYLKTHSELESVRPALEAILGDDWEMEVEAEG